MFELLKKKPFKRYTTEYIQVKIVRRIYIKRAFTVLFSKIQLNKLSNAAFLFALNSSVSHPSGKNSVGLHKPALSNKASARF